MEHTAVGEMQYKISEMTKFINVEAHVLRYWEEELQLPIKRNELGHRYYTEEDRELFLKVKQLKEKGVQLKGIRTMLDLYEDRSEREEHTIDNSPIRINIAEVSPVKKTTRRKPDMQTGMAEMSDATVAFMDDKEEKSYRLQMLLKGLIREAVEENNAKLADDLRECMVKELDYQFRVAGEEQEQYRREYTKQQEKYFQKLDEMIQRTGYGKKKKGTGWLKK